MHKANKNKTSAKNVWYNVFDENNPNEKEDVL
jgi:hypothetical protein